MWETLLVLHLIGLVGYTLLLRKSALSSINKYALAALMETAIFVPSIYFLFTKEVKFDLTMLEYLKLAVACFLVTGLQLAITKSLQLLEASVFTIIYNIRLFGTTVLGFLLLGERPKALQMLGGVIIFSSVLILNLHKNKRYKSKPVLYGMASMVFISMLATLEKNIILTIGFPTYIFQVGLVATVILWVIAFKKGVKLREIKSHIDKKFILLLLFRPLSGWSFILAFKQGSLAVTNYVSGMSVPLIVIFGILFLNERDRIKEKVMALVIALLGLTLILISKL